MLATLRGHPMSIRLMHLADLHLGAPLSYMGEKAAQRSKELESALIRALALTKEKDVHAVVIAGDLFDSFDPPPEIVAQVKAAFRKTAEAAIPIILIPGTHDSHRYARSVYRNEEFPGVDILLESGKPLHKNLNGHDVFFYGYSGNGKSNRDPSKFHKGAEDGIHIALVHGSIGGGTHWSASARDFPLQPDDLQKSGFDYVALGHHHDFREFKYGKLSAVYPGTLEGLKFGEEGERHLLVAEIGESGAILERTKHNQRTLSKVRIDLSMSGIESMEDLATDIEERADPDTIIKIVLSGTADFIVQPNELKARFSDRFFHFEIADDTSMIDSELIRSYANEDTVRGIFTRTMLKRLENSSGEEKTTTELAFRLGIEQFMRMIDED